MSKRIEGLRKLADALEAENLECVSYPDQALSTRIVFRSQTACDAALAKLVRAGGRAQTAYKEDDGTPVMAVTFAASDEDISGFGGVQVTLDVHDDGELA